MKPSRPFGFLLEHTTRLYARRLEKRSAVLGLTLAQCRVLVLLVDHEGITQVHLAKLADLEPMVLVRALDCLECHGWLERRNDPGDRRTHRLFLRTKSESLVADIWHLLDLTGKEAFADIAMGDADRMIELLAKVQRNLASLAPLPVAASAPVRSGGARAARRRERTASQP
jgi:MarR family transcriptional regulator, transcriptional regulator for hemolysin